MSPRLNLWLMRLPLWRWFARATADRIAEEELAQYRDAKARAEVGVFRASGSQLTDDARREQ